MIENNVNNYCNSDSQNDNQVNSVKYLKMYCNDNKFQTKRN